MADYPIDLARKPEMMTEPTSISAMNHPTLHLEWSKDYELPESGTMTVKFRKVNESVSKNGTKTRYSVSLDILSIEDVDENGDEGDSDTDDSEDKSSTGDRLDKMAKDAEDQAEGE